MIKDIYEKAKNLYDDEFANLMLENCTNYQGGDNLIGFGMMVDGHEEWVAVPQRLIEIVETAEKLGVMDKYYGFNDYWHNYFWIMEQPHEIDEKLFGEAMDDFCCQYEEEIDKYCIAKGSDKILEQMEEWMKWEEEEDE